MEELAGADAYWSAYDGVLELIGFEPDEAECRRLNDSTASHPAPRERHYPLALARDAGEATLNVARYPGSSSLLRNNEALVSRFAMSDYMARVGSATVQTTDLDSFMDDQGLDYLDFLKLDIEGAELDALKGGRRTVSETLLGASIEVWFHEEHVDRPLFADIDSYMRGFGFVLFDLRQLNRWRRVTQHGAGLSGAVGSGQLMYANALYFKDLPAHISERDDGYPRIAALKLASIAELLCYPDFSIEVLRSAEAAGILGPIETSSLVEELDRQAVSGPGAGNRPTAAVVRAVIPAAARRRLMRWLQRLVAD